MGLSDRLKDLRSKAEETVVEHKDQIQQTVQKAGAAADQRTGGRYSDQLKKVGDRTNGLLDGLAKDDASEDPAAAAAPAADASTTEGESATASE